MRSSPTEVARSSEEWVEAYVYFLRHDLLFLRVISDRVTIESSELMETYAYFLRHDLLTSVEEISCFV